MLVAQSCPTLCDPMGCSLLGSSVHGSSQARILEWVAVPFSRGSSWPRVWTQVSHTVGRFFTVWATREAPDNLRVLPKELLFQLCFFTRWVISKAIDPDETFLADGEWAVPSLNSARPQHVMAVTWSSELLRNMCWCWSFMIRAYVGVATTCCPGDTLKYLSLSSKGTLPTIWFHR